MPEKYQDEIEEILRQAGENVPDGAAKERPRADDQVIVPVRDTEQPSAPPSSSRFRRLRLTPGKIMLAGLLLFVAGALWFRPLVWVGLGMAVLAYLLFFVSPRSISHERRWRGQVVEEYDSPLQRLKRWLNR